MLKQLSQHVEIEFKNMLLHNEFLMLLKAFQLEEIDLKKQINYYFDTPDFLLKQKHAALRIREKHNSFELTLKEPLSDGLLETTDVLNRSTSQQLIKQNGPFPSGDVLKQLQKYSFDVNSIRFFGSLKTERAEVDYMGGLLVFDKSSYFKKVDYELEYEVNDSIVGKDIFLKLLERYTIPIRPAENKILRFYKEKINGIRRHDIT